MSVEVDRRRPVFVAGHRGMAGSAIVRRLQSLGYSNIITRDRTELDLTDQAAVRRFFQSQEIDQVVLAAARVGGIHANNTYPAEFAYENLMIATNVIHESHAGGVNRLMYLGSSCAYPKFAEQPMKETCLLTGELEPTNEPYAVAKIAGIELCASYRRQYGRDYRCITPTNLYGPGDNFHPENSHVVPGLLRRIHEAKEDGNPRVAVWGSGKALREFMHVDDMANATVYLMELDANAFPASDSASGAHTNVGTGEECSIRDLAECIAEVVGFTGALSFDTSMPDGTPRKRLDISRLSSLGWRHSVGLREGLRSTYEWYLKNTRARRE